MSRRNPNCDLEKIKAELSLSIDQYKEGKDAENTLKKSNGALNDKIKSYMSQLKTDTFSSDKWMATITTIPKESFNELKAIELLKEKRPDVYKQVIRTKEYIEEDALEKAIYNDLGLAELLSGCKEQSDPTIKLTVGKIKGGK